MEEERVNSTSEDKFLNELERKILQVIMMYNRPVTVREVADELAISFSKTSRLFYDLVEKGNLVVFSSSNHRSKYYAVSNSKEAIDKTLSQKYVDLIEPLEKKYEEIKLEQAKLTEQLNGVYVQLITLMGIFVAIFALIIINVSAIGEFANSIADPIDLCKTLAVLNVPLVISLFFLTLLIKWVIKPSKRKNRNVKPIE